MTPAILAPFPSDAPLDPLGWIAAVVRRGRWPRVAIGAALFTFALVLGGCSTSADARDPRPVRPIRIDTEAAARIISAYRAQHGLGPVRIDPRLMRVATDYARVMGQRDRIKHNLGRSLPRRVEAAGYHWGYVSENLAASFDTFDAAMRGWKKSKGHNKNLLNPYSTDIGIAAVATPRGSRHRNYWALVLGLVQPQRLVPRTEAGSLAE